MVELGEVPGSDGSDSHSGLWFVTIAFSITLFVIYPHVSKGIKSIFITAYLLQEYL